MASSLNKTVQERYGTDNEVTEGLDIMQRMVSITIINSSLNADGSFRPQNTKGGHYFKP